MLPAPGHLCHVGEFQVKGTTLVFFMMQEWRLS